MPGRTQAVSLFALRAAALKPARSAGLPSRPTSCRACDQAARSALWFAQGQGAGRVPLPGNAEAGERGGSGGSPMGPSRHCYPPQEIALPPLAAKCPDVLQSALRGAAHAPYARKRPHFGPQHEESALRLWRRRQYSGWPVLAPAIWWRDLAENLIRAGGTRAASLYERQAVRLCLVG
jgi:hypothetical protein